MTEHGDEIFFHTGPLWLWQSDKAPASWHFLTIDGAAGDAIKVSAIMRRLEGGYRRGFGAVKVAATIGDTCWATSIFPSNESGGYLLPVKAAVRKAEGLFLGDQVTVTIELI